MIYITFVPSACSKVKVRVQSQFSMNCTVYYSSIYRHGTQPKQKYIYDPDIYT
jgi:hypothetical protein